MRVAVISDIHGNFTALEAVIADLEDVSPDQIVHGGDLLGGGARQAQVVDRLRERGWPGVFGNADEMLWNPDRAAQYLAAPAFQRLREIVFEHIAVTVESIGDERLAWLRALPRQWSEHDLTVVHASPDDVWRSPSAQAPDEELVNTYGPLRSSRVVYGHIHHAFVRRLPSFILGNSGSVSLSYDGDPRAAYALVDDDRITIRRVAYDIEREVKTLVEADYPYASWIADMLRKGTYVPPPTDDGARRP
jgi:putative phosphoesterase